MKFLLKNKMCVKLFSEDLHKPIKNYYLGFKNYSPMDETIGKVRNCHLMLEIKIEQQIKT